MISKRYKRSLPQPQAILRMMLFWTSMMLVAGGAGWSDVAVCQTHDAKSPSASCAASCTAQLPRGGTSSTESNKKSNNVMVGLKSALASGLAAGCSKTILAPFDTIKTVQQQDSQRQALTLMEAAQRVIKRSGFGGLYAGLGVTILGSMPSVGLYFGVYSYSKKTLGSFLQHCLGEEEEHERRAAASSSIRRNRRMGWRWSEGAIRTLTIASSAAIGNTVASFSRVPYEVVKQSLQTGQYPNTATALHTLLFSSTNPTAGLRALFPPGGIAAQMARDIPYAVITLLSYEFLREVWIHKVEESRGGKSSAWRNMVVGGCAGGVGSWWTNPLDVVKTRLQTSTTVAAAADGARTTCGGSGVWSCLNDLLQHEGPGALWKGAVPRLIHKVPANAMFFVWYELFKRVLGVHDVGQTNEDTKGGVNQRQAKS